ncbi:uncharacterized protein LOC127863896 [Dreissena polymorpha]|uniref:uncharacterized protein LOC127863896 n=1 Tax=Dreissena polymorpha TaxID=45954 RepID=UPI0022646639|nr:uncharacterized protein LOC127863896 [Dreissena polymorpha]
MKKSKITKAFAIEKHNLHTDALAVCRGYEYFSNIIFHLYSTLLWSLWLQAGNDVSRFKKKHHLIYTLLQKPVFSGLPATLSPARNDGFQTATLLCTFSVTDANDQIIITCLIQFSNFELFREFPAPMDSFFNLVPGTAPTFAIWVKASVTLDSASSLSSLTSSALTTDHPRIPLPKRSLFPYLTRNLKLVRWLCDAIGEVHNYGPGYDMFCDVTCDNSL